MKSQEVFEDGQRFFVNGKYEESVKAFSRAIDAGAEDSLSYLSRGAAYFKLEKMNDAIRDFSKSIEIDQNNLRGYYFRGIAYLSRDDYQTALNDLNRVLELDPGNGPAHLARGTVYGLLGEDEKSARDMKTAIIQSETEIQGFADTFGVLRTQFNKAMAHMTGERGHDSTLELTEEEIEQVKKWIAAA